MNVIVDKQLVHYLDEGKGKTILLLHGWGADLQTFDTLSQRLSKSYRVVRLDLPGFGQSSRPDDDWRIDDYARFVAHFIEKLKIDSLYAVLAHSFGGRVTIKAAGKHYITPQKIVLMGSAGVRPPLSVKQRTYKVAAKAGKVLTALPGLRSAQASLRRRLYQTAGTTDYLNADATGMKQIFLHTINEDLRADAAHITQPTVLVWGENDDDTPIAYARDFHHTIQNSTLHIVPNAGHFVYLDAPEKTLRLVDDFLS